MTEDKIKDVTPPDTDDEYFLACVMIESVPRKLRRVWLENFHPEVGREIIKRGLA